MIDGAEAIRRFEAAGARLFVGVPDSLMKGFCNAIDAQAESARHVVAANEGGAVATGAGHFLATGRPAVVYMQNSGLGNAVNPLSSLTSRRVYGIPMVLLIGWRGEPGVPDEPQHEHQGAITREQLDLLDIPVTVIGPDDEPSIFADAFERARTTGIPVALLVRKGTFTPPPAGERSIGLSRIDAIQQVVAALPEETAYVATTGFTGRELALLRDQRGEAWASDFLMVGSMGHAAAISLGLAIGSPDRLVCCLDGDGAVAMHMGSLAVIGAEAPANLVHLLLNNGVHESVGGQPSALRRVDVGALAESVGYASSAAVAREAELTERLHEFRQSRAGPVLIEVEIAPGSLGGLPRPSDFHQRARDMREWLSGG